MSNRFKEFLSLVASVVAWEDVFELSPNSGNGSAFPAEANRLLILLDGAQWLFQNPNSS